MPTRRLIVYAAVFALAHHGAARASEAITMTAEAGLDGVGRPGRWLPVHVAIDNRGDDITGHLTVE